MRCWVSPSPSRSPLRNRCRRRLRQSFVNRRIFAAATAGTVSHQLRPLAATLLQQAPEPTFGASASAALELNPGHALASFGGLSVTPASSGAGWIWVPVARISLSRCRPSMLAR